MSLKYNGSFAFTQYNPETGNLGVNNQFYTRHGTVLQFVIPPEDTTISIAYMRSLDCRPVIISWGDNTISTLYPNEDNGNGLSTFRNTVHDYRCSGDFDIEINDVISSFSYRNAPVGSKSDTKLCCIRRYGNNLQILESGSFLECDNIKGTIGIQNSNIKVFNSGIYHSHSTKSNGTFYGANIPDSTLIIPASTTDVGTDSFGGNGQDVKHIDMSKCSDIKSLGAYAFYNNPNVCKVNLPPISFDTDQTSRGYYFRNCGEKPSAKHPDYIGKDYGLTLRIQMKKIPEGFFSGSECLTSVVIPKNVTTISDLAFDDTNLNNIDMMDRPFSEFPDMHQIGFWGSNYHSHDEKYVISVDMMDCMLSVNVYYRNVFMLSDDIIYKVYQGPMRPDMTDKITVLSNSSGILTAFHFDQIPTTETYPRQLSVSMLEYMYAGFEFTYNGAYETSHDDIIVISSNSNPYRLDNFPAFTIGVLNPQKYYVRHNIERSDGQFTRTTSTSELSIFYPVTGTYYDESSKQNVTTTTYFCDRLQNYTGDVYIMCKLIYITNIYDPLNMNRRTIDSDFLKYSVKSLASKMNGYYDVSFVQYGSTSPFKVVSNVAYMSDVNPLNYSDLSDMMWDDNWKQIKSDISVYQQ